MQIKSINDWVRDCHQVAVEHGWWTKERPIPELLMLIVSECAEALEEYRKGHKVVYDVNMGLIEELADIAIRLFDTCGGLGINLETAIERKHELNKKRPFRHGNKRC